MLVSSCSFALGLMSLSVVVVCCHRPWLSCLLSSSLAILFAVIVPGYPVCCQCLLTLETRLTSFRNFWNAAHVFRYTTLRLQLHLISVLLLGTKSAYMYMIVYNQECTCRHVHGKKKTMSVCVTQRMKCSAWYTHLKCTQCSQHTLIRTHKHVGINSYA